MTMRCLRWPSRILLGTLLLGSGGCATILGTVTSPITGGVEFAADNKLTSFVLPDFVVGALLAPFVAFSNGVAYDATLLQGSGYCRNFHTIFRPFALQAEDQRQRQERASNAAARWR